MGPPEANLPQRDTHTQTAAGAGGWRRPKLDQPQGASAHRPWAPLHSLGWAGRPGSLLCPFVPHSRRDKSSARLAGGCAGDVSQEPFLPKPWMRACYTTDLRIIRGAGSAGEKAVQPPGTPQAMLGHGAGQVGPASAWGLGPGAWLCLEVPGAPRGTSTPSIRETRPQSPDSCPHPWLPGTGLAVGSGRQNPRRPICAVWPLGSKAPASPQGS